MKKILVVSYHYPPDGAVGSHRVDKLVKFLRNHEFEVSVLTVAARHYDEIDPKRKDEPPDPAVSRTTCWTPPMRFLAKILSMLKRRSRKELGDTPPADKSRQHLNGHIDFFKRWLVTLNYCPDDKIYWLIPAIRQGVSLAKKTKFDWIIASAPPHSVSIITYLLSRITGIRFILDYRDPWTVDFNPITFRYRPTFINRFESFVERKILKHAALVVLNTEMYRASFEKRGLVTTDRLLTVCNGFEPCAYKANRENTRGRIILSHFGSLYLERNPEKFFSALEHLLCSHPELLDNLQVQFFGKSEYDLEGLLVNRRCRKIVRIHPPIPYRDAVCEMASSDILLAFAQNQPFQVPAKIFDYLGQGRPILLLGSEGASFNLINSTGAGLCASLEDEGEILKALEKLLIARGFETYQDYDRSSLTSDAQFEKLTTWLNRPGQI